MKVVVTHKHKCEKIAIAPGMSHGRHWWVGKLTEPVKEWPLETHCLHLRTPLKDITFLCNHADFQQLQVLGRCVTGAISDEWMDSMVEMAKKKVKKQ